MSAMRFHTVIVGAGVAGLTAAYRCLQAGRHTVLLESAPRFGGAIRSERRSDYLLEFGPNTVHATSRLTALIDALELRDRVITADPASPRYIHRNLRLYSVPLTPSAFVKSDLLSLNGKARVFAEPFVKRGREADESVQRFISRRLGREVADRLVSPFLSGVWAGDVRVLSAQSAFPRWVGWEKTKGSLLRGAIAAARKRKDGHPAPLKGLLSFRDGLETLPRALASSLGDAARRDTRVERVDRDGGGGWIVQAADGPYECDRLVLATPAEDAARLLSPHAPGVAAALRAVRYAPVAIVHAAVSTSALKRPLDGFGYLNDPEEHRAVLGCVWASAMFPGRAPEGKTLLTFFLGGTRRPQIIRDPDSALVAAARDDVRDALGITALEPIAVTRYEKAIPQYSIGHPRLEAAIDALERREPVKIRGNIRGGISVGDVVESAWSVEADR